MCQKIAAGLLPKLLHVTSYTSNVNFVRFIDQFRQAWLKLIDLMLIKCKEPTLFDLLTQKDLIRLTNQLTKDGSHQNYQRYTLHSYVFVLRTIFDRVSECCPQLKEHCLDELEKNGVYELLETIQRRENFDHNLRDLVTKLIEAHFQYEQEELVVDHT